VKVYDRKLAQVRHNWWSEFLFLRVTYQELSVLAREFIAETCRAQGIQPDQLTVHADNGPSMRPMPVAQLLSDLGITKTHSRPYVSNDNPYSESAFKTLKYRPGFPERFVIIEQARTFGRQFFAWYNSEHRHSGIAMLTPAMVHFQQHEPILQQRSEILVKAYAEHPERFVRGIPQVKPLPTEVWINKPTTPAGILVANS